MISNLIFIGGEVIICLSFHIWMLMVGRIVIGFAIGLSSMAVPLYISELSPV